MTVRIFASTRRLSSAATRSTERFGWVFESNRSPAMRTTSTFSSMASRDGRPEGRKLALALGCGRIPEICVACTEVNVCGVKQSEHPVAAGLPVPSRPERRGEVVSRCRRRPPPADHCERGAPWPSLATPNLASHCDRSAVTVARCRRSKLSHDPATTGNGPRRRNAGFFDPLYGLPTTHRCAPKQGLHIGTWIARRRPHRRSSQRPARRCPRPRRTGEQRRGEEDW